MGLATIDPHSQQEHTDTEIHKIPFKFSFKNVKINKKMYGHPDAVWDSVRIFSVFMWRNHILEWNMTFPSGVLVLSDERPYRKLTFHNVSARQSSSYCNRARLNFQAIALRDMKIETREGCRVGQEMSYHLSFC